jgi:hypothetical protein
MDVRKDAPEHLEEIHSQQSHHGKVAGTKRIHASRMEEALLQERPSSPWRKSFLRLYACIFVGYLCSATNGFDANTFGRIIPVPDPQPGSNP